MVVVRERNERWECKRGREKRTEGTRNIENESNLKERMMVKLIEEEEMEKRQT